MTHEGVTIDADVARRFGEAALLTTGRPAADAALVADTLVEADLRGVYSHGIQLLHRYVRGLSMGLNPNPNVQTVRNAGALAVLDGDCGMGQVASHRAMELAIEKAEDHGIAAVGVRNSNHLGALAYWGMMAVDRGMVCIATTNAPPTMRYWRDNEFVFNCGYMFKSRYSEDEEYFSGNGKLYNKRIWETNFIPNAPDMLLYGWKERGAGGINAMLNMSKNNMGNHISEFPIGTYKKAHRHGPGAHLVLLSGDSGYSLIWTKEDRSDMIKCDWEVGSLVIVPNDGTFHQHFNSGTKRARYMALRSGDGGFNAPNAPWAGADTSIKEGGWQVEYTDEDREIHEIFEKELPSDWKSRKTSMISFCTICCRRPTLRKSTSTLSTVH